MVANPKTHYITPEAYLEQERRAEFRSEYLNGRIYAMAGASPEHNRISRNTVGEFYVRLKGKPCEAFVSDMRVRVSPSGLYTYPDVLIVCGEMQFVDEKRDTLTNPVVIIEVLSDSTEAYDRGQKFAQYQTIESLVDYVLISQKEPRVERFTRQPNNQWLLSTVAGLDTEMSLTAVDCTLRLADIYDRIEFAPAEPSEPSNATR